MTVVGDAMPWVLGPAWGALLATPFIRRGRRIASTARVATLVPEERGSTGSGARVSERVRAWVSAGRADGRAGPVGRVLGALLRRRRARVADARLGRELPVVIDLLGVAVGSGCTPYLAVEVAARWSPPLVAGPLASVLQACALGVSFDTALADSARATPTLRPLADALLASERLGAPVGPVLARLAAEERTALRRRAEAHARRIPVRLLFPLVFLVLPAFVLLTVVPGFAAGLSRL
ncbi:MAG: type II secretion system F family protein [Acidimicrobiia bacterium]